MSIKLLLQHFIPDIPDIKVKIYLNRYVGDYIEHKGEYLYNIIDSDYHCDNWRLDKDCVLHIYGVYVISEAG